MGEDETYGLPHSRSSSRGGAAGGGGGMRRMVASAEASLYGHEEERRAGGMRRQRFATNSGGGSGGGGVGASPLGSRQGGGPRPPLRLLPPRSAATCQRRLRSMFGPQPLSHRATEPSVTFGSADRVKMDKLYFNSELSKCRIGIDGPGPIYDSKSTLGKQFISKNETSPTMRFGSANRFSRHRYGEGTPGPGTYNYPSGFGPQVLSYQQSPGFADFSRATRDQQNKIYLSIEFDKNKYGTQSPGPCVCDVQSSLGTQLVAPRKSAPKISFGGEKRFKYCAWSQRNMSPGAGQYKVIGSVGKQTESRKSNCPSFTFAQSDRDHRAKMFISMEHDKAHYGEESPGPGSTMKTFTSLGQQIDSRKASCVIPRFGTAPRFKVTYDDIPGPGQYEC